MKGKAKISTLTGHPVTLLPCYPVTLLQINTLINTKSKYTWRDGCWPIRRFIRVKRSDIVLREKAIFIDF